MTSKRKIVESPHCGKISRKRIKKAILEVVKAYENPKVEVLPIETKQDLNVERVLGGAIVSNLQDVMVLGWDQDGELYFAANFADGGIALWLMEKAKTMLMG